MSVAEMGWYVYCVAEIHPDERLQVAETGVEGGAVEAIQHQGLAAIVSSAPMVRYRVSRETTIPHIRVIEEVMEDHVVLPVRFGTVARSVDLIHRRVLVEERERLIGLFETVRNRMEAGLKVMYERPVFFAELRQEYPELVQEVDRAQSQLERIGLGQRVERAMQAKVTREAEEILARLRPAAEKERVNHSLGDVMVLNAAFLVNRDREGEFDSRVRAIQEAYRDRAAVRYVAPVPPFNFVNLVLHLEEADDDGRAEDSDAYGVRYQSAGAERAVANVPGG